MTNNVTIFKVEFEGKLSQPVSYALPADASVPQSVAFIPSGRYLATANDEGASITMFAVSPDGKLSKATSYIPYNHGEKLLSFSPASDYLVFASSRYGITFNITLFKVSNQGVLTLDGSYPLSEEHPKLMSSIAYSPTESFFVGGVDNDIDVFTCT